MKPVRRHGFVVSPRLTFPVLLVVVLLMFLVFATVDSGDISDVRIVGTIIVTAGILILFGILIVLSRAGRRRPETDSATAGV